MVCSLYCSRLFIYFRTFRFHFLPLSYFYLYFIFHSRHSHLIFPPPVSRLICQQHGDNFLLNNPSHPSAFRLSLFFISVLSFLLDYSCLIFASLLLYATQRQSSTFTLRYFFFYVIFIPSSHLLAFHFIFLSYYSHLIFPLHCPMWLADSMATNEARSFEHARLGALMRREWFFCSIVKCNNQIRILGRGWKGTPGRS